MAPKVKVRRGTTNMGEFTQEEIIERLGNGKLSAYDMIYFAKNDEWIEFDKLRDIMDYANAEYHWKYRVQGQVRGPLTKQDLIFFIKEGKIIARSTEAGLALLNFKHSTSSRKSVLPIENTAGKDYLLSQGFQIINRAPRMILGPKIPWKPKLIFSRAGGFYG